MKRGFYFKLAFSGINKNKKIYVPYILTCIGMIVMFYIILFLSQCKDTVKGDLMRTILGYGSYVMAIFSVIFLFYTNSFLIRRRKKEFGLYNILGMSKRNLARVLIDETVIIMLISLVAGLFLGILFSGFAKLAMFHILEENISFLAAFDISFSVLFKTIIFFACIFALILLNTLRQTHFSKPVELLRGGNVGEKAPKANWIIAVLGLLILAAAYYIALTVKNPVIAMIKFFIAVIMVIIATYLLFIAGSVVLCKILQKNKKYYYKTNHFVSVSSMMYRMKRNGASLASICILCTMILVMLSSVICLYSSIEDTLRTQYTRDVSIGLSVSSVKSDKMVLDEETSKKVKEIINNVLSKNGLEAKDAFEFKGIDTSGYINESNNIVINAEYNLETVNNIWSLVFAPIEEYNRFMGANETLADDEVIIYTINGEYTSDKMVIGGISSNVISDANSLIKYKVKKQVSDFIMYDFNSEAMIDGSPIMYVFVPNFDDEFYPKITNYGGNTPLGDGGYLIRTINLYWFYKFDLDCSEDKKIKIADDIMKSVVFDTYILDNLEEELNEGIDIYDPTYSYVGPIYKLIAEGRKDYMDLYGGLLMLGVILSIVFIFATILLMYYKQISEGFEDQSGFDIMQKVGMTKREIKKSINSQILTVFFAPVIVAGIHLTFAFPMIKRMLAMFEMTNTQLLITVTVISYIVFALLYALLYVITSKSYYSIVGSKN